MTSSTLKEARGEATLKEPPKNELADDSEEREVEKILDSGIRDYTLEYLIRWKDIPEEEDSWEPAGNVLHAKKKVKEFHERRPNAVSTNRLPREKKRKEKSLRRRSLSVKILRKTRHMRQRT